MPIRLSKKRINELVERTVVPVGSRRTGGGSGAGGGGGVSSSWVDEHYVSKDFFARLFTINGTQTENNVTTDVVVEPNDLETTITNIQAMVGLWTESYLSALGQGSGGGGGGGTILTEPLASINQSGIGSPTSANRVICWDGSHWVYKPYTTGNGTVTSIKITVPSGFSVNPSSAITTAGTFAISFGGTITKKYVLAAPSSDDGTPSWRALVAADIPDLSSTYAAASYFDASGNAKSALKLTTVSKKAWGRTYWTANGVPDSIDGDIENAGNIKIDNNSKIYWKKYNTTTYLSMLTLDTSNNFIVGEAMANEGLTTYLRGRSITFQTGTGSSGNHSASMSDGGLFTVEKLKIGNIVISYDSTNGGLHVENAGIYADNYVSALGAGSGGGSSSTGITMNDVWQAMAYTAPSTSSQQVHVSHLAQALTGYVKTTDLSSYVTLAGTQTISGAKTFIANVVMNADIQPGVANQYSLGTSSKPFSTSYVKSAVIGTDLSIEYKSGQSMLPAFHFTSTNKDMFMNAGTGTLWCSTNWQPTSDIRKKDVLNPVGADLEMIAKARIFDFKWKGIKNSPTMLGTAAQDWKEIFPSAVKQREDGTLTLDYCATAVASVVLVARKVVNHEKEIKRLKQRIAELEEQLKAS